MLRRAGELVEEVRKKSGPWREPPERTKAFTVALLDAASDGRDKKPATTARTFGIVNWFSDIRGYGFITKNDGTDVFVHHTGLAKGYNLTKGQQVQFTIVQSPRGIKAVDVETI